MCISAKSAHILPHSLISPKPHCKRNPFNSKMFGPDFPSRRVTSSAFPRLRNNLFDLDRDDPLTSRLPRELFIRPPPTHSYLSPNPASADVSTSWIHNFLRGDISHQSLRDAPKKINDNYAPAPVTKRPSPAVSYTSHSPMATGPRRIPIKFIPSDNDRVCIICSLIFLGFFLTSKSDLGS